MPAIPQKEIKNVLGGMLLDGVAATQGVDKSAERLLIENCDLSSVVGGEATFIWEHRKGYNSTPLDTVGSIRSAKKIYSLDDCDDERHRYWWGKVKQPFIYYTCRLYDAAGHPGAMAVAAQIRDHYANGEKIIVRSSIDGSTLEKEGNVLKSTIFRHLAATVQPCNQSCDTGVLDDPMLARLGLEKGEGEITTCAIALDCLPGEGPLLLDPQAQPYSLERTQELIELSRRIRADLKGKEEAPPPSLAKSLQPIDLHLEGGATHLYQPARFADDHLVSLQSKMRDPRVAQLHGLATKGYLDMRARLLDGTIPRKVCEHALCSCCGSTSPGAASTLHEAVTRCRGDAGQLVSELTAGHATPTALSPVRARLLASMLGHGSLVNLDSGLAQHLFSCDGLRAQEILAELSANPSSLDQAWKHDDCCSGQDALPASWGHWLVAPAHAQSCGLPPIPTDRSGLWSVGVPVGQQVASPSATASLQANWSRRFGDAAAVMLFYAHLAQLLIV